MPRVEIATRAQRQASLNDIETRLAMFDLTRSIKQIGELLDVAKQFVETGESVSGVIHIPEISRRIEYRFSNRVDLTEPNKSSSVVVIKTAPGVKK